MFSYQHLVQFYETDLMGIVHHSNYLRIYEEARVAWAHQKGLIDYQQPSSAMHFAVLETWVRHLRPARFGDQLELRIQAKADRARLVFEYQMLCPLKGPEVLSCARTVHVALDPNLRLLKLPKTILTILEKETWNETWLSSL